jgi:hypothetical protein
MANFYVTHHKFPGNPQFFTINLHKVASLGGEDNPNFTPTYPSAEEYWKLFIYTTGLDSSGEVVGPVVAGLLGGKETVNVFVEEKIALLCSQIDWSQQGEFTPQSDISSPIIVEQFPQPNQLNVPINSPVVIRVQEPLPGNGIDKTTVAMKINGISVNPSVTGNKYDFTFSFSPKPIYNS